MCAAQNEPMNSNESPWSSRVLRFRICLGTTSFTVTAPSFQFPLPKRAAGILPSPNIHQALLHQRRMPLDCVGRLLQWSISLAIHVGVVLLKEQVRILFLG